MPGRPPETSDNQYLSLIGQSEAPIMFTSELADAAGVTQQGAYGRLVDLRERGLVASKTGKETAWWLTKRGRRELNR